EKSWVISGLNLDELSENNRYDIALADIEMVNVSGLMVRMDKSLPIIFTGAGIFMVGVVIGFYWQHRRVWVGIQDRTLHFGAHTNKNWFGLKKELRDVADVVGLDIPDKPST
ncbi:MAG: cytochrome c biogenesis protein ResB, partial [Novibacillus thermophilus]